MVPREKLNEKSKIKEQITEKEERIIQNERKLLGDKIISLNVLLEGGRVGKKKKHNKK